MQAGGEAAFWRRGTWTALFLLAGCGSGSPSVGADALADAADTTEAVDTGDVAADVAPDPCIDVGCDGHGRCIRTPSGPACVCDSGFAPAAGLRCVADTPCPAGQVRVEDGCFAVSTLQAWCKQACDAPAVACAADVALPASCGPFCSGRFATGKACFADCMGKLDEPGALAETVCAGAPRRFDSIDCRTLSDCANPLPEPVEGCAALCATVDACGTLYDSRWLLGGSRTECKLYCEGLARALGPADRFNGLLDCMQKASVSCDPLALLACTVGGVIDLETRLCTELAPQCGYLPGVWADEAACDAAYVGWSPGQKIHAGGCINFNEGEKTCAERDCAHPPATWSAGLRGSVQKIVQKCGHRLTGPIEQPVMLDYYTWLVGAAVAAFAPNPNVDFAAVDACLDASPCEDDKKSLLECFFAP